MQPFYQTPRLLLRPFQIEDAEDCFAFLSHRETCHMDGGYEPFDSMGEAYHTLMQKFLSQQQERYMVVLARENKVIGTIHLWEDFSRAVKTLELGYVIAPAYQRQGFAYEALSHLCEQLFAHGDAQMLLAGVRPSNIPSLALMKKLSFQEEGIRHRAFSCLGKVEDLLSFYRDAPSNI